MGVTFGDPAGGVTVLNRRRGPLATGEASIMEDEEEELLLALPNIFMGR